MNLASMQPPPIPFNRPVIVGREFEYVADAVKRGHLAGDGYYSTQVAQHLQSLTHATKALFTTSCTHALEMSALLLDIREGDEVIMPSFTFVSTANAFVLRGARPVFAEIRPDTLNLDETLLESLITPRTRAVVVVHYAGVACEMDEICAIARRHGIPLVEDNAHGLFGSYRGRPLGSFGKFATQSFHETKNIMCGEGGAFLVHDPDYVERAEIVREKGTNRCRFVRGLVDKYTWVQPGSSYVGSDLLAAFLLAQIEQRDAVQERRKAVWERYDAALTTWSERVGVRKPVIPAHCQQAYHMYYLILPSTEDRDALIRHLAIQRICAVFHYVPLHTSEHGEHFGYRRGDLPISEDRSERLIRLPLYNDMSEADQARVVETVVSFEPRRAAVMSRAL